jgi:hypothetical protein
LRALKQNLKRLKGNPILTSEINVLRRSLYRQSWSLSLPQRFAIQLKAQAFVTESMLVSGVTLLEININK